MSTSLKENANGLSVNRDAKMILAMLESLRNDVAVLAAKLDADATVTDTDYAAGLTTSA